MSSYPQASLEIRSPERRDKLIFRRSENLTVEVKTEQFSGVSPLDTYHVGSPAQFFDDLARHWKGWSGEKRWGDLEGRLTFIATCDNLGHVRLRVVMEGVDHRCGRLDVSIFLEAGQLEQIAADMRRFFKEA
jgi:hypothetical protein